MEVTHTLLCGAEGIQRFTAEMSLFADTKVHENTS
jgi:hypothetical protein